MRYTHSFHGLDQGFLLFLGARGRISTDQRTNQARNCLCHLSQGWQWGRPERRSVSVSDGDVDQDLVQRAQSGDKRAFDLLVLKYQQKVTNLIGRYARDQSEVLDVTQDAFIRAYRALAGFRGESAFYTWLYRIAVNTVKNHLVAQGRRPPADDVDAQTAEQMDASGRLRESATPERQLLTDEIARTVQQALDALPEDLRTAIVLRELEGMSYEEIGAAMECPIGTVRSRIFRAREAIDRRLRPLLEP